MSLSHAQTHAFLFGFYGRSKSLQAEIDCHMLDRDIPTGGGTFEVARRAP
jgi:hypothetical protein